MDLNIIWFVLIGVLYTGFFILEGFDFGVGILLPFLSKDKDPEKVDNNRRLMINAIGPHWDANEVWLLTAGGATFAAFPNWYATMFSGFYLALLLILAGLIARGVAFEFRSKDQSPKWRNFWDWMIFIGSLVPPLILGVAFGNLIKGVPIDANMNYVGGFFNLLNPYALVTGIALVLIFIYHGAVFLTLKIKGGMAEKARNAANNLWIITIVVMLIFAIYTNFATDAGTQLGIGSWILPVLCVIAFVAAGLFMKQEKSGWAFGMTALTIVLLTIYIFAILFPRVMVSSLNPDYSLTIYNASSSPYTLQVMTIVALIFVPIVLIYQGWSYWIFRKRLTSDSSMTY
jgi:cytochrome d ubiquinol oxidase subunit II